MKILHTKQTNEHRTNEIMAFFQQQQQQNKKHVSVFTILRAMQATATTHNTNIHLNSAVPLHIKYGIWAKMDIFLVFKNSDEFEEFSCPGFPWISYQIVIFNLKVFHCRHFSRLTALDHFIVPPFIASNFTMVIVINFSFPRESCGLLVNANIFGMNKKIQIRRSHRWKESLDSYFVCTQNFNVFRIDALESAHFSNRNIDDEISNKCIDFEMLVQRIASLHQQRTR